MIISFGSKETEKIWNGVRSMKFPYEIQNIGRRKLRMLNNSVSIIESNGLNPRAEPWTQIPGQAPGNMTLRSRYASLSGSIRLEIFSAFHLKNFSLIDLKIPPSNRLEKLTGKLNDYYSIRINDRWRVIFIWRDGHSFEVEIIDYHK